MLSLNGRKFKVLNDENLITDEEFTYTTLEESKIYRPKHVFS